MRRNVLHALAVSDIDEIERSCPDEILKAGLGPDIDAKLRQQHVPLRLIEPYAVRHNRVDVDDHDVATGRHRTGATGAIHAERRP